MVNERAWQICAFVWNYMLDSWSEPLSLDNRAIRFRPPAEHVGPQNPTVKVSSEWGSLQSGGCVEVWRSEGIFRHFEVVEDEARVAVESALGGGDAVSRVGVDDAEYTAP